MRLASARRLPRRRANAVPTEEGTRIGLSVGRDRAMSNDRFDRKRARQRSIENVQRVVLRIGKGIEVTALELDPDREVVAAAAPAILRRARMPGALQARNELRTSACAIDEEVS